MSPRLELREEYPSALVVQGLRALGIAAAEVDYRHYIEDVPIHCGQPIEAMIAGEWVPGRYEAEWPREGPRQPIPVFYFRRPAGWELPAGEEIALRITPDMPVRLSG